MLRCKGCMTLICLLSFAMARLGAQATAGSVSGVVTDSGQAVVQNATVQITNEATGASRTLRTDENGYFAFTNLLPAIYELTVSASGFKAAVQKGLQLQVNQNLRTDVQLQVGEVRQTVEI